MHHPTNRIVHTMIFATPVVEHWMEPKKLNGSTRWDQSDNLPYHEQVFVQTLDFI